MKGTRKMKGVKAIRTLLLTAVVLSMLMILAMACITSALEFTTVALPVAAMFGLLFFNNWKRRKW